MKKFIITLILALVASLTFTAYAQIKLEKTETTIQKVHTINPYWEWIYTHETETGELEYLYVAKSDNRFDESPFVFSLGKTNEECIETLESLLEIVKSSKHGDNYRFKDIFGNTLDATVVTGLLKSSKELLLSDTGHSYAGDGHIYASSLSTAISYFKKKK